MEAHNLMSCMYKRLWCIKPQIKLDSDLLWTTYGHYSLSNIAPFANLNDTQETEARRESASDRK